MWFPGVLNESVFEGCSFLLTVFCNHSCWYEHQITVHSASWNLKEFERNKTHKPTTWSYDQFSLNQAPQVESVIQGAPFSRDWRKWLFSVAFSVHTMVTPSQVWKQNFSKYVTEQWNEKTETGWETSKSTVEFRLKLGTCLWWVCL